mmetsp:Transcript_8500/g.13394  ORF Transcript_8500/g.13394 Transcript_8500/m.13394 type:complete len:228 (+) Transcript_8500:110-793(+)
MNLMVGYPRACKSSTGLSLAVASNLASTTSPHFSGFLAANFRIFLAAALYSGSSFLQCPHQGAYISSKTFLDLSITTSSKFLPTTTCTGSLSVGALGRASDFRNFSSFLAKKSSTNAEMVVALNFRDSSSDALNLYLEDSSRMTMVGRFVFSSPYSSIKRDSLSSETANESFSLYFSATLDIRFLYMFLRLASPEGTTMCSTGREDLPSSLFSEGDEVSTASGLPKL